MNAKELRIGNIVKSKHNEKLFTIETGNDIDMLADVCNGEPLTIMWLKKWGFNFDDETEDYPNANKDFGRYNIVVETEQMGVHVYNESYSDTLFLIYARTDFVHEFQNLIFALTNNELEIK